MATTATPTVVIQTGGPSMLIRAVWFVFIGWWLTGLVAALAWFALITVIGIPLFAFLIDRIPVVLTLKGRTATWESRVDANGVTFVSEVHPEQRPLLVRAGWLVLVGWWLSAIWMSIAWLLCALIVTIPIGVMMFNMTPSVTTLMRY